jgi:hypothetical protein
MRSNFYDVQYINDDGSQVQADGPFDWEGGNGDVRIRFTITQGGVTATDETGHYHEPDPKWAKNANAHGGSFQPGAATAEGWIIGTSNPPPATPWGPVPITLAHARARNVDVPFAPDSEPAAV